MLKLTAVNKAYRSPHGIVRALKGVDLTIENGEFVAIMGPSGSGKSTLLSIVGLLSAPTTGSLQLNGREIAEMSERERTKLRSQAIGFVFQFPSLVNTLDVRENVMLPKMLGGKVTAADRSGRNNCLSRWGSPDAAMTARIN